MSHNCWYLIIASRPVAEISYLTYLCGGAGQRSKFMSCTSLISILWNIYLKLPVDFILFMHYSNFIINEFRWHIFILCLFQFFLSNRAVYLLVWNIRLGYEHAGLDFWLSSIACHAPKAPILIIGTHCDKVEKSSIPERELQKQFPQIKGFHYVSSYTGEVGRHPVCLFVCSRPIWPLTHLCFLLS